MELDQTAAPSTVQNRPYFSSKFFETVCHILAYYSEFQTISISTSVPQTVMTMNLLIRVMIARVATTSLSIGINSLITSRKYITGIFQKHLFSILTSFHSLLNNFLHLIIFYFPSTDHHCVL